MPTDQKSLENSIDRENKALANTIEKLNFYMDKTGQTLFGLAAQMGIKYQPLYRLVYKKYLPTINSLHGIANYFNCNISELIMDEIFIDIPTFNTPAQVLSKLPSGVLRVYVPFSFREELIAKDFFALKVDDIKTDKDNTGNINIVPRNKHYQIFYWDSTVDIGIFLVKHNDNHTILEILNKSRTHILTKDNENEKSLLISEIQSIAKFFCYVEIPYSNPEQIILHGKER